ncbi:MAG: autotransporter-associated beta strand repeat-containing protein [Bacteroidetes bacterium]|nr:autotransporter-associated beta strand repeat-containing protein [Bacteroidota bacterium]
MPTTYNLQPSTSNSSLKSPISSLLVLLFLTLGYTGWGQRIASVSGNWSSTATWGGAAVPTSADAVTINSGITVTVDIPNAVCNSLQINTGNATAILTFSSSGNPSLTVTNAVNVGQSTNPNREGTITFTNGSTLIAGSLSLGTVATQTSLIDMTNGGLLKVNGAITAFSGSTFTSGTGTVELTANNSLPSTIFTAFNNLIISGGTTTFGVNTTINGLLDIKSGATANINATTSSCGSLTGSGTLTNSGASRTFTIGSDNSSSTFSGLLSATTAANLSITKIGTGTLTLSGNNTYGGATTISGGILRLGAAGSGSNTPLGTTAAGTTVASGAVLDLNGFSLATTEALTINGTGISSGAALINSSATPVTYQGAITLGAASSLGGSGNITLSGVLTGAFEVTKVGAGTVTITANNSSSTFTGVTIAEGILSISSFTNNTNLKPITLGATGTSGTLLYSSDGAGGSTTTVINTAGNGGNLNNASVNNLTFSSAGSLAGNLSLNCSTSGNITFSNTLSGAGGVSVTSSGSGIVTLSGANSYTGTTIVSSGTLTLGVANALPITSSAGLVQFSGGTPVFNLGLFNLGTSTASANSAGVLDFDVNTTINLGSSGSNVYYFKASSAQTRNATTITINNWTGNAGATGTGPKFFVGNSASGLSAAQLASIQFDGFNRGALQLSTGEVVPAIMQYRSANAVGGNWTTAADWQVSSDGVNWSAASLAPTTSNAGTINVRSGFDMTISSNVSVDQVTVDAGAQLTVSGNAQLIIANGTGDDLTVNGTLNRTTSAAFTTTGNLVFSATGKYISNFSGASIPTASWDAASTLQIDASIASDEFTEVFGNVVVNNNAGFFISTSSVTNFSGSIAGNFTHNSSGTVALCNKSTDATLTIGGNLSLQGLGTFRITNDLGNSNTRAHSVIVSGNYIQNSGTLNLSDESSSTITSGVSSILEVRGSFSHTGGSISETATDPDVITRIRIVGTSASSFTTTGQTGLVEIQINETGTPNGTNNLVTLSANTRIDHQLTLTAGLVSVPSSMNLTFGSSAAISGTPSASNMIVATDGEVRRILGLNPSSSLFTFPIGDATSTIEYSPVTVSFSGTGVSGGYVSAKVINAKHPNNVNTTNHITRYWTIGQSGYTSTNAIVTATYQQADVVGTEANILMGRWTGALPWTRIASSINTSTNVLASNSGAIGDFTGINNANPSVSITGGNVTVCQNAATTLTASPTGDAPFTYSWTGSISGSTTSSTATANTSTAGGPNSYAVTVTDGNGLTSSASPSVTVTVTAPPNAGTLSGSQAICVGGSTTFTSNGNTGGAWTTSDAAVATVNSTTGTISGVAAGTTTITYTVTGTGGCANATATRTVTVTAAPNAGTLSGTQAICVGGSTTFTSNGNTGGAWTTSDAAVATVNSTTGTISGVAAGTTTITYTVTGTGGCSNATATRTVTVTAPPNAGTLSGSQAICVGGSTTFTSNGNTGGAWTTSNAAVATVNSTTGAISGVAAGTATITYTVTGTGGCANATATRTVTVNALPTLPTGINGSRCGTGTVSISATAGAGETIDWYAAASGGIALSNGSTSFTTPSISTTTLYYAEARNTTTGCVSASRTAVTATINTQPAISNQTASSEYGTATTYQIVATSAASYAATGLPAGITLNTTTGVLNIASTCAAGTYTISVTVTSTAGCTSNSATVTYTRTQKPLTITGVTVNNKVYDKTNTATLNTGSAALSGVVVGDAVTLSSGSATGTFASVNAGAGIAVTATGFSISGAAASNYSLTQPTGLTGTITPRPITLSGTRSYDGTIFASATDLSITNVVSGDNLSLTGSGLINLKDVGSRIIANTSSISRRQFANGNTGNNPNTSFSVTLGQAPQNGNTLIAVIATRGNASNTISGISQTGTTWQRATQSVNASGSLTVEIWYAQGSATSDASITVTMNQSNVKSSATVIEYNGVLSLNPLDATSANTGSGTAASTGNITTTQANDLIIAGVGLQGSSPGMSTIENSFTQVDNPTTQGNPGTNTNLFVLERIVSSTGTYAAGGTLNTSIPWVAAIAAFKGTIPSGTPFTLSGAAAGNYTLTGMTGTLTVTAKPLSITAPTVASKEYDGTNASGAVTAGTLSGLVSPETLGVTATGTYADANVGTGKTATIVYTLSDGANGGLATNYSLANGTAAGNITPRPLTITANNQSKCQGSAFNFAGTEFGSSGLISGQSITGVTLTSTGAASGAADGTYAIIPAAATGATISNYNITYVNGTLTVNPTNPASVTIASNDADNSICPGTSVTFTATPVNGGASPSYQWKLNGTNVGANSTTYNTSSLVNGDQVMVVMSYAATACLAAANTNSNTISTTVTPVPTAFIITGGGGYCTGGSGVSIGLSGSQSGVSYQLVRGGSTNVGSPVSGTGAAISFGLQTTAGTYTVSATNTTTGCFNTMTGSATVVINAIPSTPQIGVIIQPSCTVTTGSVTLNSLPSSGTWTVAINPAGTTSTGSGTSGTFSGLPANTTYTFTVTTAEGCTSGVSAAATINAWTALPAAPTGTDATRCGTGIVTLTATPPGQNQTIDWYTTSTGGTAVLSNNTSFSTPVISATTVYYAETRVIASGCVSATRTAVTATVNATPTITASATATGVTYGVTSTSLTYSATSGSPTTYSISWNASPTNSFLPVSDATLTASPISISIPNSTNAGTYTGNLTVKTVNGCASTGSSFTIAISPASLTITGITAVNKIYDGTATAAISGNAVYSGLQYGETFTVSGSPSANFNNSNVGTGKAVTLTGYTAPNGNYTLTQPSLSADITPAPLSVTIDEVFKAVGTTLASPVTGFTDFSATGLVGSETIGSITVTYGTGAASGAAAGTYVNTAVPSTATGGTFSASNYSITYVPNNIVVGDFKFAFNTGNWTDANMWSSNSSTYAATSAPAATDIVIIRRRNTVTVNTTNAVCGRLELGANVNNTEGFLNFAATGSPKLTVSGQVVIGGFGSSNSNRRGEVTLVSGATLEAEDILLTRTASGVAPGVLNMTGGGTLIANTIVVGQGTATWTPGTGTVILASTNNLTLPATVFTTFNNLTINAGKTVTSGVNFSVAGTMTVNGIFTPGATTHVVSGAGTLTGSGEIDVTLVSATALTSQFSIATRNLSGMTVEYRGAGNQSMAAVTYGNLVTAGSGIKTLLGTTAVNGNLTIGSGTTFNGGGQSLDVKGNWINSGTFTHGSGSVTFSGAGMQTLTGNSNFNNFTVTNTASNISLATNYNLGVEGTFTPNGTTFGSQSGSTINFNGASAQIIPAFSFVNLSINGGGTKTLSGAVTVSNVLTLTSGDISLGNHNLTLNSASGLSGGSENSHIITGGTGVFRRTIGGAATYFFPLGSATHYNPVTYAWSSAPGITRLDASYLTTTASIGTGLPTTVFGCTVAAEILNNGYWNFTPTGTLSNNPSISVGRLGHTNAGLRFSSHGIIRRADANDDWAVAGVWVDNGNTVVNPVNTGNVSLTQSGLLAFGEIAVAKGTGTNSVGLWIGALSGEAENAANWGCNTVPTYTVDVVIPRNVTYQPTILNGNLTAKSITINSGATLRVNGQRTISLADGGAFTNNGSFVSGNQSKLSFEGSGSIGGTAPSSFNELTLNGATTFTRVPTINGNLRLNTGATVSAAPNYDNNAVLVYSSTNTRSVGLEWTGIGTTPGAGAPNHITVENSGTLTISGNRSVPGNFTLSNGVVDVGDNTLSLYGDVTVTGGSFTSGAGGTVLYAKEGNNQNIAAGNYGNLTLNNYSKVLASSGTIGISGTFTPGNAAHTTTGSTLSFNGSGAQNIPAFNYNNLTIAGSNTKTAAAGLTVAGNVLIQGTMNAGSYTHKVSGNWTNNGSFSGAGGTVEFDGNTTIGGTAENSFGGLIVSGRVNAPAGNMNIAGNLIIGDQGQFIPGSGTVTFNSTAAPQSIESELTELNFNNLAVSKSGQTLSVQGWGPTDKRILNVTGNLSINSGTLSAVFTDINMNSGNWSNNGGNFTTGGTRVTFSGTSGNQLINGSSATQTFEGLTINKNGRTLSVGGSTTRLVVTDTLNMSAGTFDAGSLDSLRVGGAWLIQNNASFTPGNTTVAFTRNGTQSIPAIRYHKLSILGTGAKSAQGNLTVNDELNISSGRELDMGTNQLLDGGNLNATGSGKLRTKNTSASPLPNGKTWSFGVQFEGAAEQTVSFGTYNGGVTINNSSNGARMNGNVTAASVTLSSGDLAIQSNTLTLNGAFSGNANNALRGSNSSNLTIGNGAAAGILFFRNSSTHNFLKDLRCVGNGSATLGNRLNITAGAASGRVKVDATSLLASNGNLVLKSDTTGTAFVDEIENCTTCAPITGEVEVERAMPNKRAWRLVTIPVTGNYTLRQQLTRQGPNAAVEYPGQWCATANPRPSAEPATGYGTLITGHSMSSCANAWQVGADHVTNGAWSSVRKYTHINNVASWGSNNTTNFINYNAIPSEEGYLVFVRGDRSIAGSGSNATTFRFKGTLRQGNTNPATAINAPYGVMSNPYVAPININDVFNNGTGNADRFERNFWIWDGDKTGTNGVGGYRSLSYGLDGTYTCADCSENMDGQQFLTLNSGQSYMVQRKSNVSTAVGMIVKESDKISNSGNIATMRMANARLTNSTDPSMRIRLFRANGMNLESFIDATTVRFNNQYQSAPTEPYDIYKINNQEDENISLLRTSNYLAIESRPLPAVNDTLFVPTWRMAANIGYALSISTANLNRPGLAAELIDTVMKTRTQIPLNGNPFVYPFTTTSGNGTGNSNIGRFRVVFTQGNALPVDFVNVRAKAINNAVQVDWEVANEENLQQYEVERSTDGREFTAIGTQQPRNLSARHLYSLLDKQPASGTNFYRIKALDNDGSYRYSATVKVNTGGKVQDVKVYPTTVDQSYFTVDLTDQPKGIFEITLANSLGQVVMNRTIQHNGGSANINVDLSNLQLTGGVHFLSIKDEQGNKKSVKLIIKK